MAHLFAMTVRSQPAADATRAPRFGRLASAAMLLSASFVLSRALGLLRIAVIAHVFGDGRAIEAWFAAFRIPDTMFTLVSGGAMASAFVPLFTGLVEQDRDAEAWEVASTVLNTVFIVMAGLAAVAFIFTAPIMNVLVSNYTPSERDLTIELTRIMLLQPIFLGVAALLTAILQAYHRFLLTGIAPLLYNVSVIVGALLGQRYGVSALAWAVVIGAAAQVAIQFPGIAHELRHSFSFAIDWGSASAREVLRLLGPRIVGLAAFQAMLLITLYLAQKLPPGSVGAINYAWPLVQFPVGALGMAAATAIFPTLARLTVNQELDALRHTVNRTLRLIIFLSTPAAVGLIVLRRPIVNLIAFHGTKWTPHNTEQTAFALLFFAVALAPLSSIEVLARVFYAMRDTITPVRIAIVAVAVDAALSIMLVRIFPPTYGPGGLALATAVATTFQVAWLAIALDRDLTGIGLRSMVLTLRDAAAASLVMGMVLYIFLDPLTLLFPQRGWGAFVTVVMEMALGGAAFFTTAYLLRAPELWQVRSFALRLK
jgi:putative peptidoglycan lipid II flippase